MKTHGSTLRKLYDVGIKKRLSDVKRDFNYGTDNCLTTLEGNPFLYNELLPRHKYPFTLAYLYSIHGRKLVRNDGYRVDCLCNKCYDIMVKDFQNSIIPKGSYFIMVSSEINGAIGFVVKK